MLLVAGACDGLPMLLYRPLNAPLAVSNIRTPHTSTPSPITIFRVNDTMSPLANGVKLKLYREEPGLAAITAPSPFSLRSPGATQRCQPIHRRTIRKRTRSLNRSKNPGSPVCRHRTPNWPRTGVYDWCSKAPQTLLLLDHGLERCQFWFGMMWAYVGWTWDCNVARQFIKGCGHRSGRKLCAVPPLVFVLPLSALSRRYAEYRAHSSSECRSRTFLMRLGLLTTTSAGGYAPHGGMHLCIRLDYNTTQVRYHFVSLIQRFSYSFE